MNWGLATDPVGLLGAACFGLLFGSFSGVLVARVPAGEGVVRGRSRCDACARSLGAAELIPVVSWALSRGRCRSCGARVTFLWTAVEVATALAFGVAWSVSGDAWEAILLGPFMGILIALSVIDVKTYRLPDAIVFPASMVALAVIVIGDIGGQELRLVGGLIGAASFGGALSAIFWLAGRIYGEAAMGLGDVKLAFFIGLVIGSISLASVAVAAGAAILIGGLAGLLALALGAGRRAVLPFGPMLCAGAFIAVVYGRTLADAYLGLLYG